MSRCLLDNHPDGFDVVIGWDPGMGTFFAQVSERGADDPFRWLGAVDQHLEPDRLIEAIRPYACAFDEELLGDNLRFDQHANSGRHYDATLVATTPDPRLRARIMRTSYDNGLVDPCSEPAHFASLVRIVAHYGHPKAAADLALMYHHGFKGAPQDRTKAAQWASVAVEQDLAAGTTHSIKRVLIGAIIIGVIGVVALLLVV